MQLQYQRNCRQEDFLIEQEYCSFDRRHRLAFGIQNWDAGRKGFAPYTFYYIYCTYYTYDRDTYDTYTHYTNYFQVRQELGLADHVWQDRRAAIAETVDALGDQFRPAMRAGWLSYIQQAYPADAQAQAGPPVPQGMLVLPDWVDSAHGIYEN